MENLLNLMLYFIKEFPQTLGRTQLIKAIYLLDCEWYKIYGTTYSGLTYRRDQNGPFSTVFYEAKDTLVSKGLISEWEYPHPGGIGYEYCLVRKENLDIKLHPIAECIASEIVEKLRNKDLKAFLDMAYSTLPMRLIFQRENEVHRPLYGEVLPMNELYKSPEPLFSLDEIKDALKKMDLSDRGSDEEYGEVVFAEFVQLAKTRERLRQVWESIGEK